VIYPGGAPAVLVLSYLVGFGSAAGVVATVVAVVMVATAAVGFCPLYAPFHFHTNARRGSHDLTRGQDPASTAIAARSVPVVAVYPPSRSATVVKPRERSSDAAVAER
jgi:Inner membrane protein YgaP-like, transmembrane domain